METASDRRTGLASTTSICGTRKVPRLDAPLQRKCRSKVAAAPSADPAGLRPLDFVGLRANRRRAVCTVGAAGSVEGSSSKAESARTSKRRSCPRRLSPSCARPAGHSPARSSARAIARRRRLPPRRPGRHPASQRQGGRLGPSSAVQRDWTSSQRTAPKAEGNSTCGPPVGTLNSSRAVGTRGIARSKPEGRLPGCTVGRSVSSRRYSPGSAISRSKALPSGSHSGCTARSSSWAWPGSRLTSSRRKGIRTRAAGVEYVDLELRRQAIDNVPRLRRILGQRRAIDGRGDHPALRLFGLQGGAAVKLGEERFGQEVLALGRLLLRIDGDEYRVGGRRRFGRLARCGRIPAAEHHGGKQRRAEGNDAGQGAGHLPAATARPPGQPRSCRRRTSPSSRQNMTPSRPWEKMTAMAAGSSRAGSPSTTASTARRKDGRKGPRPRCRRWPKRAASPRRRSRRGGSRSRSTCHRPGRSGIASIRPFPLSVPGSAGRSSVFRQGSTRLPVFATQRVEGRLVFASPQAAQQAAAEAERRGRPACGSWP